MIKKTLLILTFMLLFTSSVFASVVSDGVDDRIVCGTSDIFTENGAFTWYFRLKTGSALNTLERFADRDNVLFYVEHVTGRLVLNIGGGTTLEAHSAAGSFATNTEYAIVLTHDGSTTAANAKFYINSTTASTHAFDANGATPTDNSADTLYLFNRADSGRSFNGTFREAAYWGSVQSAGVIADLINRPIRNTPLANSATRYWKAIDGTAGTSADGDTFVDMTGNANCTGEDGANNAGLTWGGEDIVKEQPSLSN